MTKKFDDEKPEEKKHKFRWRFYETETGNSPVKRFLDDLRAEDVAEVLAEMKHVSNEGLRAARHVRGEIYEVRATAEAHAYRVLFAKEGQTRIVLLALEGFPKKSQKCPPSKIALAEARLKEWRKRGKAMKTEASKE
jgi:phage-related protein